MNLSPLPISVPHPRPAKLAKVYFCLPRSIFVYFCLLLSILVYLLSIFAATLVHLLPRCCLFFESLYLFFVRLRLFFVRFCPTLPSHLSFTQTSAWTSARRHWLERMCFRA